MKKKKKQTNIQTDRQTIHVHVLIKYFKEISGIT